MLKISADKVYKSKMQEIFNTIIIIAYGMFFISMICTTIALKRVTFKAAPVIESVGYIYILILSAIILKEKITFKKILGNIIIIIGIIIFVL